ncbi:MAG: N-acetylmuramoyl-L-alanine amidase, partial [Candidatus Paceibacterota bacterium]
MNKIIFPYFLLLFLILTFLPISKVSASGPIKILLVPGHDDPVWGAQYKTIKESDMNLALAIKIFNLLKLDKRFEVHITREWGGYTKEFSDYFTKEADAIVAFKENAKSKTLTDISSGDFMQRENVPHNNASETVANTLYGINRWANENQMDAIIHIHFNDYPRNNAWKSGIYKGFVVYMPEAQMANAEGSQDLAMKIYKEMHKSFAVSTYPKEAGGIVPDQSLIALGSNG